MSSFCEIVSNLDDKEGMVDSMRSTDASLASNLSTRLALAADSLTSWRVWQGSHKKETFLHPFEITLITLLRYDFWPKEQQST